MVYERLVENFEDVHLRVVQTEPADMVHDRLDDPLTFLLFDHPVEEVALDGAVETPRAKRLTGQRGTGVVGGQLGDGRRDRLGDHYEEGVLHPKPIVLDVLSVDEPQQLRPQLPLELGGKAVGHAFPKRL